MYQVIGYHKDNGTQVIRECKHFATAAGSMADADLDQDGDAGFLDYWIVDTENKRRCIDIDELRELIDQLPHVTLDNVADIDLD